MKPQPYHSLSSEAPRRSKIFQGNASVAALPCFRHLRIFLMFGSVSTMMSVVHVTCWVSKPQKSLKVYQTPFPSLEGGSGNETSSIRVRDHSPWRSGGQGLNFVLQWQKYLLWSQSSPSYLKGGKVLLCWCSEENLLSREKTNEWSRKRHNMEPRVQRSAHAQLRLPWRQ